MHAEAMVLGNFDVSDDAKDKVLSEKDKREGENKPKRKCPCCDVLCQQDTIKFCTSFDNINNIGTSTYLYFHIFKNLTILLVIMGVFYSIYAIITNIVAAGASADSLYNLDYLTISLAAKQKNVNDQNKLFYFIQCWLGVFVIFVWFLILIGIKYHQIKVSLEQDQESYSAPDFSIVL